MNRVIRSALLFLLVALPATGRAASPLLRSAPEAQGVSSAALLNFVNTLDGQIEGMHSLMILRHNRVIAEGWWKPYAAEHNHVLYSLSKSFTSTAVGFATAEGKLTLDDEVLKFFPEAAPAHPTNNLKAMRVRDLLTMATGHQDEPPISPDALSAQSFLAHPVPHLPGTHFKYNTAATFLQSAIVQKLTGQTVLDYLQPRLFAPLGIQEPVWETNFEGISLGGYGLRVRTEDIAKFGQFYLQKGRWNGQQLLPAEWVALATSKQVSNGSNPKSDWNQGYGFQFWRCRHNAYRGDGAFGQYCLVMPDQDVVVAITSGARDMQAVLNVIWEQLLSAFGPKKLRANAAAHKQLRQRLASLEVPTAQGAPTASAASRMLNRRFSFPANDHELESVALRSVEGSRGLTLELRFDGKTAHYPCGHGEWNLGRAPVPSDRLVRFSDEPVAGSFAWQGEDTLILKICAYETPFHLSFKLRLDGDKLTLEWEQNVAFGPTKRPTLLGVAE